MKKLLFVYIVKRIEICGYAVKYGGGDRVYWNVYARWKRGTGNYEREETVTLHTYDEAVDACRNMMNEIKEQIEKEVQ